MSDMLERLDELNARLDQTTRILLIFVRGKVPDGDGEERWDDVEMGWVTNVPNKGDTVRLEGVVHAVTRVHYNAETSSASGEPILYAFVHLGLATVPDEDDRWPR